MIPEGRQHLHQSSLAHTSLPFNDHRYTTPVALVDVQHLEGVVQGEDIVGLINLLQTTIL